MVKEVSPKPTLGSPVSKTLVPFSSEDLMTSFLHGIAWGSLAIALIFIGAWLISVMRQRVFLTTSSTLSRQMRDQSRDFSSLDTSNVPTPLDAIENSSGNA